MIDEEKWLPRTVAVLLALIVAGIFVLAVMFAPRTEQKRYYLFNHLTNVDKEPHQYMLDPTTGDLYRRYGTTWEPFCSFPDTATAEKIRLQKEKAKAEAAAKAAEEARQRAEWERGASQRAEKAKAEAAAREARRREEAAAEEARRLKEWEEAIKAQDEAAEKQRQREEAIKARSATD